MDLLPDQSARHFALDIDECHTGVAVFYPTSRRPPDAKAATQEQGGS